ncbi:F-box protein CPR1-like [Silene latifolia]|uniref:F-box protein CPR1-like n=1 Tax=Silene latifolia TaxID=37657 RepID=UPI003D76DB1A
MATLPTDLIVDILSNLSPKILCRFKCVAKSWNSLINDPNFIKFHYTKSLNSTNPNLIICSDLLSIAEIPTNNHHALCFSDLDHPVKQLSNYPTVQFLGSCNGIICISDHFKKTYFLYNPHTKTHRLIPPVQSIIPDTMYVSIKTYDENAYQRVEHMIGFGFGFDLVSDDYKLLRVIECYEEGLRTGREVRLYSLKNDSWKMIDDDLNHYPNVAGDGVYYNGVLYFVVVNENNMPMVKCFDLKTETFSLLKMFDYDSGFNCFKIFLAELSGCLCVMVNYLKRALNTRFGYKVVRADLWVRKNDSWFRLFIICDPMIQRLVLIRPIVYSKDGGRILLEFDGISFFWYEWGNKKFEKVEATGLPPKPFDSYTVVGSLVSLGPDEKRLKGKNVTKKETHKKSSDSFLATGFKLRL